ncbi:MAG TPA: HAD-IA family hydrolase [Candidatus Methylacidiphilales bacterium]|jgi:putative hydrolase of the HAD superfamily|nr:HAD-IA family hydrolase [Candidatus Methylacidiphilales bacterium]
MARVRAFVFDVGGTLIYPAEPVGETYARFARPHGVKLPPEATTAAFRQAMKNCAPRAKDTVPKNGDDRTWWKQVVRHSLPEKAFTEQAAFDVFFEEVYLYYAKPDAWGIYPEVLEVLEALRDHAVDLVVLSNWDARLHAVLDGNGIGEFLSQRFISAELGWEKPDPAIYRHVAEFLRLPPEALLSVGDDPRNDVEGPRKAGWQAMQIERPKRDLWTAVRVATGR